MNALFPCCLKRIFATGLLAATVAHAQTAATVTIYADQPEAIVSSNLFGIFYEEINYADEGGLYAEMVRNRSFYHSRKADFWTLVKEGDAKGTMSVDAANSLNTSIRNSLRLTLDSGTGSVGAGNAGFWGMSLQAGAACDLNFYARSSASFFRPGQCTSGERRRQPGLRAGRVE